MRLKQGQPWKHKEPKASYVKQLFPLQSRGPGSQAAGARTADILPSVQTKAAVAEQSLPSHQERAPADASFLHLLCVTVLTPGTSRATQVVVKRTTTGQQLESSMRRQHRQGLDPIPIHRSPRGTSLAILQTPKWNSKWVLLQGQLSSCISVQEWEQTGSPFWRWDWHLGQGLVLLQEPDLLLLHVEIPEIFFP